MDGLEREMMICADCKKPITGKTEPADGWQLDDGRTVCGHCCAQDLKAAANLYPGDQVDVPEGVEV